MYIWGGVDADITFGTSQTAATITIAYEPRLKTKFDAFYQKYKELYDLPIGINDDRMKSILIRRLKMHQKQL